MYIIGIYVSHYIMNYSLNVPMRSLVILLTVSMAILFRRSSLDTTGGFH